MPRTSSGRSHHGRARDRADPPFGGILPDSAGPRRRTGGRCWEWLPLAAALCTALAVSFASHRLADGVRAMEGAGRRLAAVRADAYRLNALEWQAVTAGAVDPSFLDLELNTTLHRVRGLLEAGGSQAEPLAPAVRRAFGAYEEVVGQEWRLLAAGRPSEASALQRERSGPDFRALVEAVDEEIAGAAERAGAADLTADLGVTSLVVSALVVGAGFRRLLRARRSRAADEEMFLRKSEARFRSLVENSSDVITVVGADATILDQSTAVEAVFGYPSGS